jgi:hypothetical protein
MLLGAQLANDRAEDRVPIGSWLLLTSTAAFESKRMVEPSAR